MKKSIFTLAFVALSALCLCASVTAQTILRVNNNMGITGTNVYSTIQAAHNAANTGDIIYVEPSSNSYGSLICIKQLTIIGNGFASEYSNIATTIGAPADGRSSQIDGFTMNNGSQGSKIIGIRTSFVTNYINVPNITIDRCDLNYGNAVIQFGQDAGFYGNNATITRCRFFGPLYVSNTTNASGPGINCTVKNCIFIGSIIQLRSAAIINNTFNGGTINAISSTISNNLFTHASAVAVTDFNNANSNAISNNLSVYTSGLPANNGNINGATLSSIFVNSPLTSYSPDSDYKLAAGSPAIGTGSGGVDMGAFGASSPYILSGLPPYPIITNFTNSGVGNSTTPLSVSITVRGNN